MAKKRAWSYGSYGKNALNVKVSLKGLDEYLEKVENMGGNIEEIIPAALEESAKVVLGYMEKGSERHKRTGDVYEAIEMEPTQKSGNTFSVEIGINLDKHPEAIHAVFQEYGAPTFPADPFIRPAFDNNKAKIKRIQKKILIQGGLPTG